MAAPLSQDLRRCLVQAVEAGSSAREAARRFAVSESAAINLARLAAWLAGEPRAQTRQSSFVRLEAQPA